MNSNNPPPGGGTPLRGNRVHIIQNENTMLKQQIQDMQHNIDQILNELQKLKQENIQLKEQLLHGNGAQYDDKDEMSNEASTSRGSNNREIVNTHEVHQQYHTDEEELERETNWILQKSKKNKSKSKIRAGNQSSDNRNQPEIVQIETSPNKQTQKEKLEKPPPINIVGIPSYEKIKDILKSANITNFTITALNNNVWKVNTIDSNGYRSLSSTLNSIKIEWYTYENKNDRPNKVIIRGLHPTCTKEDIMEELKTKGFNPIDAVNILKKERIENSNKYNYRQLPIFRVTFHKDDSTEEIYKITNILKLKVKVEAFRPQTKLIPQCKRCQGFNHTKHYCQREARCVKCAGKHDTEECTFPKTIVPKCINCKGNHPASYRGCDVAKELQKIRNKNRLLKDSPVVPRKEESQQLPSQLQRKIPNHKQTKTFSEVLIPETHKTSIPDNITILSEILRNMEKINRRLDSQAELNEKLIEKINAIIINSQN